MLERVGKLLGVLSEVDVRMDSVFVTCRSSCKLKYCPRVWSKSGVKTEKPKDGDECIAAVWVSRTEEVGCWREITELLTISYLEGGAWGHKRIERHSEEDF